jgi:hypothetical protein
MSLDTASAATNCPPTYTHPDAYARTLHRACEKLGGIGALSRELGMRSNTVHQMLQGKAKIPHSVFLTAVDILLLRPAV